MSDPGLKKTPLHDLHLELGARMVPFAGYDMPVQYPSGIVKEHLHTRAQAGLFDVSHMGQVKIHGSDAAEKIEQLVPVDVIGLSENRQRYALFTNDNGGILDDLMITNAGDHLFVVVNAACKQQDIQHMQAHINELEVLEDHALLALQGPATAAVMERLCPESTQLIFMSAANVKIDGIDCFITRSGYSGEDGFEISVAAQRGLDLAQRLLAQPEVEAIGLGARDSLRLEAGLCLYGHDIDQNTTPVQANLKWALSKARRADGARPGGYPGYQIIQQQLDQGVDKIRVGIAPDGRAPIREGTEILNEHGETVGHITSGGFGPSVGRPVAMGYVSTGYRKVDTQLAALVRGKQLAVTVESLPFVKQRYYRG